MCAIFGVFHAKKAAELCVIGLHANQHRAMDYVGIVSSDGAHLYRERGAGLARQVFSESAILTRLHGLDALGHIRYPTVADEESRDNIQPVMGIYGRKQIAIAHNGNITNTKEIREQFPSIRCATSLDTEYILRLLEIFETGDIEKDIGKVCSHLKGSFAFGVLSVDRMIAIQDPHGNRPLSIGESNGSHFISSENAAFANVGAKWVCDVRPGSMVTIDAEGLTERRYAQGSEKKCRFEAIYYGHPSSTIFGERVTQFRVALGEALEVTCPAHDADFVMGVPDSAILIAMGYGKSGASGTYFPMIFRNHYVGRSFLAAKQAQRDDIVSQKLQFTADEIYGRKIVVVDDSIVRGTTTIKFVRVLRFLGAREIHLRIACPPIKHPCTYGINTPTYDELIAAQKSVEEIRKTVGADSLEYLPLEVLKQMSPNPELFCYACMDGTYW